MLMVGVAIPFSLASRRRAGESYGRTLLHAGGRALLLLAKNGLITLKDPSNPVSTLKDITANPKGLKFKELESATLPRVLNQVDLAVINTNYALDAKLDPAKDALLIEDKTSPYVNFLVTRPDNAYDPRVAKLAKALTALEGVQKAFNAGGKHVSLADVIVLGGCAAVEKAAKNAGKKKAEGSK
mgnify:CR=1 FL=1